MLVARNLLFIVAASIAVGVAAVGCGSSDSGSFATYQDAGPRGIASTLPRPSKPPPVPTMTPPPPRPPLLCAPDASRVQGFTPTWKSPNALHAGVCTSEQIDLLMGCTFGTLSGVGCDDLDSPALKACADCTFTVATTAHPGPLLVDGSRVDINVPGCVAHLTGDLTTKGCGARLAALDECARVACGPGCPLDTDNDFAAYDKCAQTAAQGACATFAQALTTCVGTECSEKTDFVASATRLTRLFCAK